MKKVISYISLTATFIFVIVLIVLHGLSSDINPIQDRIRGMTGEGVMGKFRKGEVVTQRLGD